MWRLGSSRAKEILGINRRNLECIFPNNPRARLPLVDDKLKAKACMDAAGIPVPRTYVILERRADIASCLAQLVTQTEFVVKPAKGMGGHGVLPVQRAADGSWVTSGGRRLTHDDLQFHLAAILSGMFARDSTADRAFAEEHVHEAEALTALHGGVGVSDVRIIVAHNRPVMAMLRLPTGASQGRANLHSGGIGVGIDMERGVTRSAISANRVIHAHPDTQVPLVNVAIPAWSQMVELAAQFNGLFGLDYLGIDLVVDARRGVLVLEANARPGLAIQLANHAGLRAALRQAQT